MENNLTESEHIKLKTKILLSTRQNATNTLIILIGGVIGIYLMELTPFKIFLICLGLLYTAAMLGNLYHAEQELKVIYNMKGSKYNV